ncbi:uncharacterized protein V6R79_025928 [Siganus canaliculatus]
MSWAVSHVSAMRGRHFSIVVEDEGEGEKLASPVDLQGQMSNALLCVSCNALRHYIRFG